MRNLCDHRGQLNGDLYRINDIRNGFLALSGLHDWFDDGGFAFLKVCLLALCIVGTSVIIFEGSQLRSKL
jgi:hypothetical protein